MAVEQRDEFRARFQSGEFDLRIEPELAAEAAERGLFRPLADNGKTRLQASLTQNRQRTEEKVRALIAHQPTKKNEVEITGDRRVAAEQIIAVGIADHHGRSGDLLAHRIAHRDVESPAHDALLQAIAPADTPIYPGNPGVMRDDP